MAHPLSGYNSQLGEADFSNQSIVQAKSQYDSGGFVDDFAGINGENDESLQGFGSGDEYVGATLGAVLSAKSKRKAPMPKFLSQPANKFIFNPLRKASAQALLNAKTKAAAAVATSATNGSDKAKEMINTSIPVRSERRLNRGIPSWNENDSMDYSWENDDEDSELVHQDEEGQVVSNGGQLTQAQISAPVIKKAARSIVSHPLLAYSKPMNGFEGLWDDIKSSVSKTVSSTIKSGTDNLLTSVTESVTGNKVLSDAAKRAAVQKAAEAAVAQTKATAATLVQQAQNAQAFLEANKQKLLIALAAVGSLGAYLLITRRRAA